MLYDDEIDEDIAGPFRAMRGMGLDPGEAALGLVDMAPNIYGDRQRKRRGLVASMGFGGIEEGGGGPGAITPQPDPDADEALGVNAMNPALAGHLARRRSGSAPADQPADAMAAYFRGGAGGGDTMARYFQGGGRYPASTAGPGGHEPPNPESEPRDYARAMAESARPKSSAENRLKYSAPGGNIADAISAVTAASRGSYTRPDGTQAPVSGAKDAYRHMGGEVDETGRMAFYDPNRTADDIRNLRVQTLRGDGGAAGFLRDLFAGDKQGAARFMDTGETPWDVAQRREKEAQERAKQEAERAAQPKTLREQVNKLAMQAAAGDTAAAEQLRRIEADPALQGLSGLAKPQSKMESLMQRYKAGEPDAIQQVQELAEKHPGWAKSQGITTGKEPDLKAAEKTEREAKERKARDRDDYNSYRQLVHGSRVNAEAVAQDINAERANEGLPPLTFAKVDMKPEKEIKQEAGKRAELVALARKKLAEGVAANWDPTYARDEVLKELGPQFEAAGLKPLQAGELEIGKPVMSGPRAAVPGGQLPENLQGALAAADDPAKAAALVERFGPLLSEKQVQELSRQYALKFGQTPEKRMRELWEQSQEIQKYPGMRRLDYQDWYNPLTWLPKVTAAGVAAQAGLKDPRSGELLNAKDVEAELKMLTALARK